MAKKQPGTEVPQPGTVLLEVPVDKVFPGYVTTMLNCRLTARQGAALKFLWSSLSERGERYQGGPGSHPDGTSVDNGNAGIRWLLDRLADAIERESGQDITASGGLSF